MALNTAIDTFSAKKIDTKAEDLSEIISEEEKSELDTAIMKNSSIDEISVSPIEIHTDRPAKKKFVIKKNEVSQKVNNFVSPIVQPKKTQVEAIKSFIFPSSIRAIGSKVSEP